MNNSELLQSVIDKYELAEPVPIEARGAMERSRKDNLTAILKKEAKFAFFVSLVVSFFFWKKRFGFSISIVKCTVAVTAALIIGTGALTAAGVYTTVKVVEIISEESAGENLNSDDSSKEKPLAPERKVLNYSVAVSRVEMDGALKSLKYRYTNELIKALRKRKGTLAAVGLGKLGDYARSGRILSASIIKLSESSGDSGSAYRISVKVIDRSNSRVLLYDSETAENEGKISGSIIRLVNRISVKI